MSFILDALKKSESERQRQSGPALFEVKVAPPRSRFAVWGAAVAALLVINFVVVGFVLWHGSASRAPVSAAALQSGAVAAAPEAPPGDSRFGTRAAPGVAPSAAVAPTAAATVPPSANVTSGAPAAVAPAAVAPAAAAAAAGSASSPTGSVAAGAAAGANPDDLAPAVEPRGPPSQPVSGVIRATESGLPTYQDASAEPGSDIPSLKLDLHVYAPEPDQRFVFLEANGHMQKLREGDTTPQGVRVEQITEDGVILSYRGKGFVLQHQ